MKLAAYCLVNALIIMAMINCQNREMSSESGFTLSQISTNTSVLLQAFAQAEDGSLWVSGHKATYGFSQDGGKTWQFGTLIPEPADSILQFRDIALTTEAVFLMSAGPGEQSRIYKKLWNEENWKEIFRGQKEEIFLNSIAFFDAKHGLAYGDSFNNELYLLETTDGGGSWKRAQNTSLPAALDGEGGFASSGSCIQVLDEKTAIIATGNAATSRLLLTNDAGKTWQTKELAIPSGEAKGATGVVFGANETAWFFGGDLNSPKSAGERIQMYHLGMEKLFDATDPAFEGAIYGFTHFYDKTTDKEQLFAVNPNGLFASEADNFSWKKLDSLSYWALISTENHIFAAGPNGRIVRLSYSIK